MEVEVKNEHKKAPNFVILTEGNFDHIKEYGPYLTRSINYIGGVVTHIISVFEKEMIQHHLFCASCNNINAIIVTGDTKDFSTIVYDAIKEVIETNALSAELNTLILYLNKILNITFNRAICGIRENTFIINMCGSYESAIRSLKANKKIILQIIDLIQAQDDPIKLIPGLTLHYKDSSNNESDDDLNKYTLHHILDENMEKISKKIQKRQKPNMISVKEAINMIRSEIRENEKEVCTEIVYTYYAFNRILAKDMYSNANVPSYRTSAKYGFAVLASDKSDIRRVLPTSSTSISNKMSIVSGTCMRVKTGAPIPDGATAVVMLENTKITEKYNDYDDIIYFNNKDKEYEIDVLINPKNTENIRDAGYKIKYEQLILKKYSCLGSAELNILTLCGFEKVPVIKVPSVGLLSIGDELKELGEPLTEGYIYDSSRMILISLLRKNGYDPIDFGISVYECKIIVKEIRKALKTVDILVTMGHSNDKDLLQIILKKWFEATIFFGCVDMKPGKSTMFATCMYNGKRKYFLCMSSNPITVSIVAHILLLPFLNEMQCIYTEPISITASIKSLIWLHPRPKYLWTTLQWTESKGFSQPWCTIENQDVMTYQKANALLILPASISQNNIIFPNFSKSKNYRFEVIFIKI